jgi:hypothetical protein
MRAWVRPLLPECSGWISNSTDKLVELRPRGSPGSTRFASGTDISDIPVPSLRASDCRRSTSHHDPRYSCATGSQRVLPRQSLRDMRVPPVVRRGTRVATPTSFDGRHGANNPAPGDSVLRDHLNSPTIFRSRGGAIPKALKDDSQMVAPHANLVELRLPGGRNSTRFANWVADTPDIQEVGDEPALADPYFLEIEGIKAGGRLRNLEIARITGRGTGRPAPAHHSSR